MAKLTIYQKPTCSTCREAIKLLQASGEPYTTVDYYQQPFTAARLKGLLKKAGLRPREALRAKEDMYKKLGLAEKTFTDDELIALMIKHPDLIQRPLVEKGEQVILARPAETIKQILADTRKLKSS